MFADQTTIFASGGGTIRWEIEMLAEAAATEPHSRQKIVLLKGLGGSTDKLANDENWIAAQRAKERELGRQFLFIIDADQEPDEVRKELEAAGYAAAREITPPQ